MILLLSGKDSSPAWRLELALACISVGSDCEYCCVRDGRRKLGRIIIFCSVDAFLLYALRVKVVLIFVYGDDLTFDSLLGNGGDVGLSSMIKGLRGNLCLEEECDSSQAPDCTWLPELAELSLLLRLHQSIILQVLGNSRVMIPGIIKLRICNSREYQG